MTAPRNPIPIHHVSSESLVDQALACGKHARHELASYDSDPQARTNVDTDLRQMVGMLEELRRRYGNQRRAGA